MGNHLIAKLIHEQNSLTINEYVLLSANDKTVSTHKA